MTGYPHPLFDAGSPEFAELESQVLGTLASVDAHVVARFSILTLPCSDDGREPRGPLVTVTSSPYLQDFSGGDVLGPAEEMMESRPESAMDEHLGELLLGLVAAGSDLADRTGFIGRPRLFRLENGACWVAPFIDVSTMTLSEHPGFNLQAWPAMRSSFVPVTRYLEALIREVLIVVTGILTDSLPSSFRDPRPLSAATARTNAIHRFLRSMESVVNGQFPTSSMFHILNSLATSRYEKAEASGVILFVPSESISEMATLDLRESIQISEGNGRVLRKLLEMTRHQRLALISDFHEVRSFALPGYEAALNSMSLLKATVSPNGVWKLCERDRVLLTVSYGFPVIPLQHRTRGRIRELLNRTFSDYPGLDAERLLDFVFTLTEASIGTTVVISSGAEQEAIRLRRRCFPLEAAPVHIELAHALAAIDGAILLDPAGVCHAIGVILDGVAGTDSGEPSRGSRYNSADAYVAARSDQAVALVFSSDGEVSVLPRLEVDGQTV